VGSLRIPSGGLVYLDANCIIYRVERVEPYLSKLLPVFEAATAGSIGLVTSQISLLECLVEPVRRNDRELEDKFRAVLLGSREIRTVAVMTDVLERAVRIRADHGLKSPDAIHAASAMESNVGAFYTNDPSFKRVGGLPVEVLKEALE